MKRFAFLLGAMALFTLSSAGAAIPSTPSPAAESNSSNSQAQVEAIAARLHPRTGDIRIPAANAVLHLGQDYYFLPADEARIVLTEGWGNPPDAVSDVLGIVFPAGRQFYEPDVWGAVITYDGSGYVSDSDAGSADYGALLNEMQAAEPEANQHRTAAGYPTQHLVGWAEQPVYNPATHSVVWARNIQTNGEPDNTLNYDIRLLGRNGVLSLNVVTVMSQLAQTRQAAQRFAAQAEFTPGFRYADHQSDDRTAEYGVAGLVAAGVGVAAAQKIGLLAVILLFLKKVGILIAVGIAGLWAWLRRLIGRRKERDEAAYHYEAPAPAQPVPAAVPAAPGEPATASAGEAPPPGG